jgi:hypothetical protein
MPRAVYPKETRQCQRVFFPHSLTKTYQCPQIVPHTMRKDAAYCGLRCKNAAAEQRRNWKARELEEMDKSTTETAPVGKESE